MTISGAHAPGAGGPLSVRNDHFKNVRDSKMTSIEQTIEAIRTGFANSASPVLSLYADINPARPENAGRAWLKRIKNAIAALPEIRDAEGKRDTPLYDQVMNLLAEERPEARTLALFASRGPHGRLMVERLDLQVDLPIVDLAHGRVEARFGEPYVTPLLLAADEYERVAVLQLEGAQWRVFEVFLGEIREDTEVFRDITADEWKELKDLAKRIEEAGAVVRKAHTGGTLDKLSPKERLAAKVGAWMHKLYTRLAQALNKAIDRIGAGRLVLMGPESQVRHFESYLPKTLRNRVVARIHGPETPAAPNAQEVMERVQPVLDAAEREAEMRLLDRIQEQPGVWGLDPVIDALQWSRVDVLVLPWSLEAHIWRCPDGAIAASEAAAKAFCDAPVQLPLRDHIWTVARDFGARIEFVRGEAEARLLRDFKGAAALLRW